MVDTILVLDREIGVAKHTRADPANVKPAQLRFTQEKAVGQADIIDKRPAPALEPLDHPPFSGDGENEIAQNFPVLRSVGAQARIAHVARRRSDIDIDGGGLAASRADTAVTIIVNEREAENRAEILAQCIAQIITGQQRITRKIGRILAVGEEFIAQRHVVIV